MAAPSSDDTGKVYQYLTEYISAKNYPPRIREMAVALRTSEPRVTSALKALDLAGKIRFIPAKGFRAAITLTALQTQPIAPPAVSTQKPSIKPAILKPAKIICVQCPNPVCEKSKWYCDLHLRLNREAAKRCLDKKRKAGICLRCDVPAGPVSRVLCKSHRKKRLEATARCRERIAAKAPKGQRRAKR
jgi:hypothetical protein